MEVYLMDDKKKTGDKGGSVIPFQGVGKPPPPTSKPEKRATEEQAMAAIGEILSCYPDYGTATPEYIVKLADTVATYPASILPALTDLRTGLASTTKVLPTVAHIVEFCDAMVRRVALPPDRVIPTCWVKLGSPEWFAWDRYSKMSGGRGWPIAESREPHNFGERGWYFLTNLPPSGLEKASS
jgi:hypothetical protein